MSPASGGTKQAGFWWRRGRGVVFACERARFSFRPFSFCALTKKKMDRGRENRVASFCRLTS
ncbi:hypothetical protein A2276_07100 [candidate division WOR-1 bacterium RIFOXYA12_FULL_43_27]|uniref:Uncharacterized protein n=1 Tax=candidate division WOR-1 bacterium RIFOXYC2_FULL_46_14 TaxID=1802587 RepID=A0A1F4U316_UNCSA|nr:MAG: hypothetical protein A2276_07100 [candidate division WOR-1 bacterium RIFOXYA12_FULL_43_27]OGC18852.1 MAG: hypothetical protein A2292_07955 [candidate division WOR-1 bacterium RIFOXYB2_FULL_46_45]OGC28993.1 MAG: hypothetical protein A2232_03020 [candidate division WOR-1 bacterium RIFOXYA2_FULL_46_56]OGC39375.1 MAG: hypothetical protein A2438_06635 [candidate division WOR-1 bacterium RIFOXYC2_FULL_46_14]